MSAQCLTDREVMDGIMTAAEAVAIDDRQLYSGDIVQFPASVDHAYEDGEMGDESEVIPGRQKPDRVLALLFQSVWEGVEGLDGDAAYSQFIRCLESHVRDVQLYIDTAERLLTGSSVESLSHSLGGHFGDRLAQFIGDPTKENFLEAVIKASGVNTERMVAAAYICNPGWANPYPTLMALKDSYLDGGGAAGLCFHAPGIVPLGQQFPGLLAWYDKRMKARMT
ncbi:MAG: hypothetical protein ACYC63_07845 [Armatimonadota bacterium]